MELYVYVHRVAYTRTVRKQIHNFDHDENQSRSSSRGGAALTAAVDNLPAVGGERVGGDRGRGRGQDDGRGGGGRRDVVAEDEVPKA